MKDLFDRFHSDISVRWRLIGMVMVMVAAFAISGGYLSQRSQQQRAMAEQMARDADQVARLRLLQNAFGEYRYWQLAQLADADENRPELLAQTKVRLELAHQRLSAGIEAAEKTAPEAVAAIQRQLLPLNEMQPALTALVSSRDPARNPKFVSELRTRLDQTYETISEIAQRAAAAAAARYGNQVHDGMATPIVIAVISIALLLIMLIMRSLVRPMEALVTGTEDLMHGKLDSPLPVERDDEIGAVAKAIDHFREASRRWDYLANHDALTGLGNRSRLQQVLGAKTALAQQEGKAVALLYVALDQFTNIGDTLGPSVADEFLRLAARRLHNNNIEGAQVFYLGGLHFAVLSAPLANDARLVAAAEQMARGLVSDLSRPFSLQDHEMDMAVNIGIVTSPQDGVTYDDLIGNAHAALTHSRKRSTNGFQFYTRHITEKSKARMALASQLRRAVEFDELQLHYQPILDVAANQIVCAEALVRWQHPTRGLVMPGEFIQVAEECGVINAMGEWCLAKASMDARRWRAAGVPPIKLAVNLSARQLNEPGLVDGIQRTLEHTGASPTDLELEITESAMMLNPERSARVMRHLKSLGITLSMDDFGTGYSSLTYLQRFPLDKIKIDRSFVSRLNRRRKDELIISATTSLAADLGLSVVAEGVETQEQMQALQGLGCHVMQGFLFSRGLPLDDFVAWATKPHAAYASYASAATLN